MAGSGSEPRTMSKQFLQRFVFGIAAVSMACMLLVGAIPPQKASANSGEVYTWTGNTEISVTGGALGGSTQKLTGQPAGVSIGGTLTHSSGCVFQINILLGVGGTTGTVNFPQSTGGTPIPNLCNADLIQGVKGPITINGTRPAPGNTPETALQRTIFVTLNSPDPPDSSPDEVTFTLKDSGGKTLKTVTAKQDIFTDPTDNTHQSVRYQKGFEDIDPGNYQVCFSAIVDDCVSVTKIKYKQASIEAGESLDAREVNVRLELSWSGPAQEQTAGPATLLLKKGGATVQTMTTDTQTFTPSDAQQQAGGLITIDFQFFLRGTFTNVDEGKYQICVSGTKVCVDYTKLKGTSETVVIKLDGQDAANIILGGTDDEEKPVCQASSSAMSWFLCPIYNGLADASDWLLLNFVVPFLRPSPVGLNPDDKSTGAVYQIWSDMRVIADIILVILLLVAVISQAYGGGIVQSYTAKKMLPRILVGAILINTSIYVVAFAIDMANVIGSGIGDLITAPLVQTGNFTFNPTNTQAFAISGIAVTLTAMTAYLVTGSFLLSILPLLLVAVVLPIFLAMMGIFITLILLQGLYMALTIFSPIAFALYAFPNTEKYFKTWWDWLFRSLLVYPIFMTILALSDVFTVLIQKANAG